MRTLRAWFLRLRGMFRKERLDGELAEELTSHLEMHIADNVRAGMTLEEARRDALIKLGGVEQTKETVRDRRGLPWLESLLQDLRFGMRMLRKNPGLTAVAVVTLALGIGANTALFGIVNGILLRPLPVRAPEQIMVLACEQKGAAIQSEFCSYPDLVDFQKQADTFSDLFAYDVGLVGLSADGRANNFVISYVTGNYFSALGLQPAAGRLFLPGEGEKPGEAAGIVLAYSYWQKRFGGDPGVIGKQVLVDGRAATIIGVGPKGFSGVYSAIEMDGYLPLNLEPAFEQGTGSLATNRGARPYRALGRLNPGASLARAQSSANVIAGRLAEQYPATDKGMTVRVIPERQARPEPQAANLVPFIASSFLALAALVLLLACMNVANVLLVRATVRQREMGIRASLGAGRGRLIQQMLTESLLLALLGGTAGVILGEWANRLRSSMFQQQASNIPLHLDFGLDWRVFSYAFAAAMFTGIVVGVWPALRVSRTDVNATLREGGRSDPAGVGRHRLRSVLMVTQLAGSLVLLIVAGLFVRSLHGVQKMYLGFDPDHVLNVAVDPHGIGYDEPRTRDFYRKLETRVRALPGVQSAALAFSVPMGNWQEGRNVYIEGHPPAADQQPPLVLMNLVDSAYFDTMRVPLLRGRAFTEYDNETATKVAIVDEKMAKQFWPNEEPIGKRFSIAGGSGPFVEVIGVVRDGKYSLLALSDPIPFFYLPYAQAYSSLLTLQIRSSVRPESLIVPVQETIRNLAPDLPIFDVRTMEQALGGTNGFFVFRLGAGLAMVMGLIGLTLAVVGVYGVVSYSAEQRTHEIGIRMALGAGRREILSLILRQGTGLVIAGVLCGLAASWALTRTMSKLLVGVSATDPLTFASVTLLLAAIALWACYIPARRAMRVDPMVALRYE